MIFAAGRGERLRPLTDRLPKPLVPVRGKPLIVWHLEKLAACGVEEVVINTSWLGEQLPRALGDGARWGLVLRFLDEGPRPLETGGGLLHALPVLGRQPFWLVNGDVFTDFDFCRLPRRPLGLAHLVMVPAAEHAPAGDFHLAADGRLHAEGEPRLTYAGIGCFDPALLDGWEEVIGTLPEADRQPPRFRLAPLLRAAMRRGAVTGELHRGAWTDVGTAERLAALEAGDRAGPGG
ncbi:MAG: mannose-1-phosphate guanylyltransferase [Lysobacteraceae bacterium]|nr:MAG: mannose-1-phosphate guanylyltransferase [Xanthomonadaceae bacterium]